MYKSIWLVPLLLGIATTGYTQETQTPEVVPVSTEATDSVEQDVHISPSPREQAVAWILSFITRVAPPGRETYYKEAQETKEEALVRYNSIANDIVTVVYAANTKPLFRGGEGRARTISVILGIMLHESGFMRNVDYGLGKLGRGDKGNSWCLMQMNVGRGRAWNDAGGWNINLDRPWRYGDDPNDIVKGSTGREMVQDRKKCIVEGLRLIKISFRSCHSLPLSQRLNIYASGNCKGGSKGSALRLQTATKFWDLSRDLRTFKDKDVLEDMKFNPGPEPEPDPVKGLVSVHQDKPYYVSTCRYKGPR